MQSVGLPLHIFDNNVIDLSERTEILQHQPGLIGMIVKLQCCLFSANLVFTGITRNNQAVSLKIVNNVISGLIDKIVACIIIHSVDIQKKLRVIAILDDFLMIFHPFIPLFPFSQQRLPQSYPPAGAYGSEYP